MTRRAGNDAVDDDAEVGRAGLRGRLEEGSFVDLRRLLIEPTVAA